MFNVGPKSHTAVDLWRMIWQENVNRIVMLANLVDDGKVRFTIFILYYITFVSMFICIILCVDFTCIILCQLFSY